VGLLLKRRGVKLPALLLGGKQERGQRAGTENVAGIAGMARAAEEASEKMVERALYVAKLRDTLEERLSVMVDGLRVNGSEATRLPNTSNLSFSGVSGQMLMILLDIEGVAVSTGSACASQSDEPSRVLMAAGRSQEEARESIRVSLSHENTEEEIDYAVGAICRAVEQIRAGGMGLRK
jgi:cysteine desulfurase